MRKMVVLLGTIGVMAFNGINAEAKVLTENIETENIIVENVIEDENDTNDIIKSIINNTLFSKNDSSFIKRSEAAIIKKVTIHKLAKFIKK